MTAKELIDTFERAGKRVHLVGTLKAGVLMALDLEGRLFTMLDGKVMNRVNPHAIMGQSTRYGYLNPGGDGLWPAPEGTCMGYNYASGVWRVSPGLSGARYQVTATENLGATIEAEIDLINSLGIGIPTIFSRTTQINPGKNSVTLITEESIQYIGKKTLDNKNCLIAPWSLCQFDCGHGCDVTFPCCSTEDVWDMYPEKIGPLGTLTNGIYKAVANGTLRYQIAMSDRVPWIELNLQDRQITVHRQAEDIPADQHYIDISDSDPTLSPDSRGIRYSVYSDKANFMEIEAAGGTPSLLKPGTRMSMKVLTKFQFNGI